MSRSLDACFHYTYEGTVHLNKALLHILASTHDARCELCPKDSLVKQQQQLQQQKKKKKKKKKGIVATNVQTSEAEIDIGVCLTCLGNFCVAADVKADSHAREHAEKEQHWWVSKYNAPTTVYCFKCDREVEVRIPSSHDKEVGTVEPDLTFVIQGLRSLGTLSCFNAVLQNLLSLRSLRKEMLGIEFPRTAPISIAFQKLFVRTSCSNAGVLSQEDLLSHICSIYPHLSSSPALESEELFRCFLYALHTQEKEAWEGLHIVVDSTVVNSIFVGKCSITKSCSECSCCFVEDKEFFYLPVPVPSRRHSAVVPLANNCAQSAEGADDEMGESNGAVSLENCLKLYTDPEPWICEKCGSAEGPTVDEAMGGCNVGQDKKKKQKDDEMKVFGAATKRILISIPPPVLTLHLKRFRKDSHDQAEKLKIHVQYEEDLRIGPFMDPRSGVDSDIAYRLAGVVLHNETTNGGHYSANVRAHVKAYKQFASCWFNAIDEKVKRTVFQSFEGEPHLLFYQKVMPKNPVKEDMKVDEKAKTKNKQREAAGKEMHCTESVPDQIQGPPELKVETPLHLVCETVEGSHHMETHANVIKGLPNLSNSCFFNVMIQNLLALDPLRCKMLEPDVWTGPLAMSLRQLFLETSALNPARGALNPTNLFKSTCSVCPKFVSGRMEDCHDLLCSFLCRLREEEAEARQLPMDTPVEELTTFVNSIFGGSLSHTVSSIQCPHQSTKPEPFLHISLPIPTENLSISIEDCWALFTVQEPLQGPWECSDCRNEVNAMMKTLIARAPPVLVVALKRYEFIAGETKKLTEHVRFKEGFDMQPFIEQSSMEMNTLYQLVGVVQHFGGMEGGHYVAFVRGSKMGSRKHNSSGSKSWFFANDEHIREASLDEVLSCEAYLLFYERCLTNGSLSSINHSCEEPQPCDINRQPHSSANPTSLESQLQDTNMQSHSSPSSMGEESQLSDISTQPQTGASDQIESPPELKVENPLHLWEYQRTRNRNRKQKNEIAQCDDLVGQSVGMFLDRFILKGDIKPFYHCELVTMCERGSGSRELNIHYSHLLSFSKGLSMDVCNGYKRLRMNLKETAIQFAQKLLAADLNLTDAARKRMQQLASIDSSSSLELKFLKMPRMHERLVHFLQPPLTEKMHVYGIKWYVIRTPFPEKCALVQKLLADMISNHRAGLSWDGVLTLDDVDVYDDRVLITRKPKSFCVRPNISPDMVSAMEKDFDMIAQSVLKKFECPGAQVPYLTTFIDMLSGVNMKYPGCWSNMAEAEAMRELIEHHPFLKPAMARSNLWSGIFTADRSHDAGDDTSAFKSMLHTQNYNATTKWFEREELLYNRMVSVIFHHKDPKPSPADPPATDPTMAELAATSPAGTDQTGAEPTMADIAATFGYYEETIGSMFELLRHLGHHGSAYSFEYRPLKERGKGPRKQLMQKLEETEVAAAIFLEEDIEKALAMLLRKPAMTGLLESVWECYKNCNHPYPPRRQHR